MTVHNYLLDREAIHRVIDKLTSLRIYSKEEKRVLSGVQARKYVQQKMLEETW